MESLKNNSALDESFLPSNIYNSLPHVGSTVNTTSKHQKAKDILLELIFEHKVNAIFSVHLVHKHFDAPDDHVMVYETFQSPDHPTFQVFSPKSNHTTTSLRGKYFLALPEGTMRAYEYTTDPLPDVSRYNNFITAFSRTVLRLGVEKIFALTVRSPQAFDSNEIELPDLRATVLIQNSSWLPEGISTDWANEITTNVLEHGAPMREVRIGNKCVWGMWHGRATFEDGSGSGDNGVVTLNGSPLEPNSDAFNVISRARQYISVM